MLKSRDLHDLVNALLVCLWAICIFYSAAALQPANAGKQFASLESRASSIRFVRLPAGTILQVVLRSSLDPSCLSAHNTLEACTASDTTLSNGEILRAGTRVFANVSPATEREALLGGPVQIEFNRMQLHDGTVFPISARILEGGRALDSLTVPDGKRSTLPTGYRLRLQLDAPAQVAVTGTAM